MKPTGPPGTRVISSARSLAASTATDVYAYGVISSSTLYRIRDGFPAPEGYAEIEDVLHMTGGEAANSSIVLSRLGARVKLDGNWIGDDDSGRRTRGLLSEHGVDTSRLALRDNYRGVQEVVFAAGDTRTIFGTYAALQDNEEWNAPREEDITAAAVVCLDPFFAGPANRVAEVAAASGIPVVTVDCLSDSPLLPRVAAIVVAESFIRDNYPNEPLDELFRRYLAATTGLVVFTFGGKPAWYGRQGADVCEMPSFEVAPIDTTGGGDSFRAGIVYAFLQGWDDERAVSFAAAIAGLNCTRSPGVLNSPSLAEVESFIADNAPGR